MTRLAPNHSFALERIHQKCTHCDVLRRSTGVGYTSVINGRGAGRAALDVAGAGGRVPGFIIEADVVVPTEQILQ